MEGNKDEAQKCVSLAKRAMIAGDFAKAHRLLEKAQRMFPSAETEALAAACSVKLNGSSSSSVHYTSAHRSHGAPNDFFGGGGGGGPHGPRQRRASPGSPSGPPRSSEAADPRLTRSRSAAAASTAASAAAAAAAAAVHTPEQAALCETVLRESCYYKTLGVTKDASEETIRKAYKRWALVLHPDKNKAPKAEDAFKKGLRGQRSFACLLSILCMQLNKVCSTLLDPHERRRYDLGGEDALEGRGGGPSRMQRPGGGGAPPHPDIMTAEGHQQE
ncbi:hypothetical protein ACSSS7_008387 [Eimeria intestinalis]